MRVAIGDMKLPTATPGVPPYKVDEKAINEYYPFGMIIKDRSWSTANYRYGYNGKENDNEVKGTANSVDYGERISDPRAGRFLSQDPLKAKYAGQSPYVNAGNNPITFIDHLGKEPVSYLQKLNPWFTKQPWQWYALTVKGFYDKESFNSALEYSTQKLMTSALPNIYQRNAYYEWVHSKVSHVSKWFGAAEIVTRWNSVGAAEGLNAWFLHDVSESFLKAGNEYLLKFNMANAKSLMNTGGLSGSFVDGNGETIKFDGLKGKALDYAMVKYEQTRINDFISKYKKEHPDENMNDKYKDISKAMSGYAAPAEVREVMNKNFEDGKSFNFGNYNDRVKLGEKLIDKFYEKKKE